MTTVDATTAAASPTAEADDHDVPGGLGWALRDSWNEATRHLRAVPRSPELLVFATIQPLMFVLLFRYVFGGAIAVPGYKNYAQFVVPGIFAQTVVFGSSFTAVGLADDLSKGFIDRLRSLPISQPAVLVGRTMSDLCRNLLTFATMLVVGFAVGFRFDGGLVNGIAAIALLLSFSYSFSWIQALIGMSVSNVEAANSAGFLWMFPLTFISSAFVPTKSMPSFLQGVAEWNPFTLVTNAARTLFAGKPVGDAFWQSALWAIGITLVFSTLSIRKFTRSAS